VLVWEGAPRARIELTLLDAGAMRRLNARTFGRRRLTDVIAFTLPQADGSLLGDVYVCPAAAARFVANGGGGGGGREIGREDGVREELIRLAVHGTLHVLGYAHSDGPGRTRSRMWQRQERYVRRLLKGWGGGGGGGGGRR
jgi:probable rRNA maturation factor